ncbi:alpha/beta hydrolase [Alicyclobacillus fodiniaquatilis]|uniref:Alpha/beta hydrolase n=1 Tax=Alicyclobacillus fodiniaquatilis TaxID=1661150 RepID=A0ABW4JR06_9BACL
MHKFIPSPTGQNDTTLLLLHGTGGNEEDLIPLGQFLAADAALIGVRGKILENGMPRFFRRLSEGVFDEEDLIFRTHELARFIEEATKVYALNTERIIAVGYSNGANIAASMLLLEPTILSAAVLFRAMVPLQPEQLPDLKGKPVLMQSGRRDPIVPATNSEQLVELLKQAGADVTLNWQNAGHGLLNPELVMAEKWIRQL